MKLAAFVLCLSVFATGCYNESVEQLQQQIDELQINSLIQQVAAMQNSVDGLASLKDQLKPAVEKLQEEKSAIEAEIQRMLTEAGDVTKLSAEQKAQLEKLQTRMEKVEGTIAGLEAVNADLDVRIAAIEEIINTPESGLKDRVTQLEALKQNFALAEDLAKIKGTVDDMREAFDGKFVAALEDLKDQISTWVSESTEIKNLFNNYYDCAYIDAALAALKGKDAEQDSKILELASSISAIKTEIQESVLAAIDGIYDKYDSQIDDINDSIDAFKKNFDDIVAALWDKIGREDLAIEGTIVSVINTLIERFGTLDIKTGDIDAIASALRTDLDLFRSDFFKTLGEGYENETLAGLHKLLNDLQVIVNGKADKTNVDDLIEEAKKLTADVQAALEKYIADNNAALEDYIQKAEETYYKKADVEALKNTYATVEALTALDAKYQALVEQFNSLNKDFEAFKANETTIMGMIQKLNDLVGIDKEKKGWTSTIVEAVNDLYVLLGQKLNKDEVTEVASGIVNGFINEILGVKDGGTAEQVKALLDGFANSINELGGSIGTLEEKIGLKDLEAALGDDKDIAAAIANIKSAVADIKAELEDLPNKYAAKEHTHTSAEISDLADTIKAAVEKITGRLIDLKTDAKDTLVDAINELLDKFGGYYTSTEVDELLSTMQSILAAAIMHGTDHLDSYFASLNLTALKDAIDDIVEAETGTIDTRIKAAIEALNVDQYLTETELLGYDYATHTELKPAMDIAAAMATLKVTLGSTTYDYDELDDAIEAVYSALQDHISNYDALKGSFEELEGRMDAVEALIGDGFDEEYTIEDAVDAINTTLSGLQDLIGNLGSGNTVQSLYEGLQNLYDALVNALVGKTSGGTVGEIDSSNNLNALKASLAAIGFDTIKNSSNQSLTTVLKGITDRIDVLESTIGITVSLTTGDNDVITALNRISAALGSFTNTAYGSKVSDIEDDIQNLLNTLSGKTSGATVSNLPALATLLSTLSDRLDNFNDKANTTLEEVVGDLSDDVDELITLLGGDMDDMKAIFGDDFVDMATELYALKEYIYGDGLSKNIAKQATEFIRQYLSVDELLEIIGTVSNLKTESKTLVGAINELLASFKALGYAADENALNKFRNEILFGSATGSGDYESLKALGDLIDQLAAEIGTQPAEFANTSIYAAISALRSALTDFENEIGEGDGSVWDAIDALYDLISGSSSGTSLAELIHSLVYIPEYADGRATVVGGNLEMSFALSADASFDIDDYTVSFAIKEVRTRADAGETVPASASFSGGVLTVTASGISNPTPGAAQAAVVISEKDDSDSFSSQYVPLYFKD